jgi:hypothetical protein
VIVSWPVKVPVDGGVVVSVIWQFVPALSELPQLLLSMAKEPVTLIWEMTSDTVPLFDSVTAWGALVIPHG